MENPIIGLILVTIAAAGLFLVIRRQLNSWRWQVEVGVGTIRYEETQAVILKLGLRFYRDFRPTDTNRENRWIFIRNLRAEKEPDSLSFEVTTAERLRLAEILKRNGILDDGFDITKDRVIKSIVGQTSWLINRRYQDRLSTVTAEGARLVVA